MKRPSMTKRGIMFQVRRLTGFALVERATMQWLGGASYDAVAFDGRVALYVLRVVGGGCVRRVCEAPGPAPVANSATAVLLPPRNPSTWAQLIGRTD
jgi:hypothetical protein